MARASPLDSRENAIGFLRVVLATLVIYYHCFPLTGIADPRWNTIFQFSLLAVPGFFFLSGMLITRSFLGTGDWKHFLWNRVLRIFPGYWVCLLVVAFGFAALAAWHDCGSPLALFRPTTDGPVRYFFANLALVQKQPSVAGVFAHNPYPLAVNGSLWTLINEFACYLAVCALGVAGLLARRRGAILAFMSALFILYLLPQYTVEPHLPQKAAEFMYRYRLLQQGLFFGLGSLCWLYREKISLMAPLAGACALAWLAAFLLGGLYSRLLVPIAFSYLLLWLAFRAKPVFNFDKKRDLSYGIYIYAFPVQQTLVMFGFARFGIWVLFAMSLAGTIPFAWLSWSLVEKKALSLKRVRFSLLSLRKPASADNSTESGAFQKESDAAKPRAC